jgi:hypothetical protein
MDTEQNITAASSRDDAIEGAAYELRGAISAKLADLADLIMERPELGSDEWQRKEHARIEQEPEAMNEQQQWHLIKIQIAHRAKLDPTGDVINAKRYGATWQTIADTCGISRQAAFDRWCKVV